MTQERPKVYVVIPAAGSGTRIGGATPKQFLSLEEKPILVHTVQRFEASAEVDEIGLAVPEDSIVDVEGMITRYRLNKVSKIVSGGEKRQDSVFNVLKRLDIRLGDLVLVHDGVRPFVAPQKISELVAACRDNDAAVLAVQPKDSIRRSNGGGFFDQMLDRSAVWLIQTPQAFKGVLLLKAFEKAVKERFSSTDEAALVERMGVKVKIVEGSYDNIKITTKEDLELGALILQRWHQLGFA